MSQLVNLPDGSQASFPDGTSPDVMKAAIQKRFPPAAPPPAPSPMQAGVAATGTVADPQNLYDTAVSRVQQDYKLNPDQVNAVKQQYDPSLMNLARSGTTFGLSDELSGLAGGLGNLTQPGGFGKGYQDFSNLQNRTLDLARAKNGMLGGAVELGTGLATIGPEKAAIDAVINGTKTVAPSLAKTIISSTATGGGLGAVGGFTSTNGDVNQRLQGAEKGGLFGASLGAVAPTIARGFADLFAKDAMKTAAPSLADLKTKYDALYQAGDNSGVTVNRAGTIHVADQMHQIAQDAGVISPTGKLPAEGYSHVKHALQTFDDYAAGGSMSLPQIKTIKETLQAAAGSADKGERRVGVQMLKKFQDFVNSGVPEYAAADPIFASAKNGEKVQTAIENAKYPGSSLNSTFSQMSKKIESGKLTGFNPEEAAAIKDVAMGGPTPGNIVSDYLKHGLLGVAGAPVKAVGNMLAAGKQEKLAQIASALVRSRVVPRSLSSDQQRLAQALLNSGALGGVGARQIGQQLGAQSQ